MYFPDLALDRMGLVTGLKAARALQVETAMLPWKLPPDAPLRDAQLLAADACYDEAWHHVHHRYLWNRQNLAAALAF